MTTITEKDAQEFGLHERQGGWRLGLLVARNVDKSSKGGGANRPTSKSTATRVAVKISVAEFAKAASVGHPKVSRYLKAWEAAADAGHVPASADLKPGQDDIGIDFSKLPEWSEFYVGDRRSGAVGTGSRVSPGVVQAAIAANPEVRKAAVLALRDNATEEDHVAAVRDIARRNPQAVARGIAEAPEERQTDIVQAVRREQLGRPPLPPVTRAGQKAATAGREDDRARVSRAFSNLDVHHGIQALKDAAEHFRQVTKDDGWTSESAAAAIQTFDDVAMVVAEVRFKMGARP